MDDTRGNHGAVKARQVFMFLCSKYLDLGPSEISRILERDPATCTHGIKSGRDIFRGTLRDSFLYELHRRFSVVPQPQLL